MLAKTGITKATIATSTTVGEAEDERRVHQRRFDLAAKFVGFLDLVGDPVQRLFEAARLLAGADHRPVEPVEDLRVALHRLLQRACPPRRRSGRRRRLPDLLVLGLLLERVQGAQHRHPRGDQGRELAREDGQLAHVDALPTAEEVLDVERFGFWLTSRTIRPRWRSCSPTCALDSASSSPRWSNPATSIARKSKVVAPATRLRPRA